MVEGEALDLAARAGAVGPEGEELAVVRSGNCRVAVAGVDRRFGRPGDAGHEGRAGALGQLDRLLIPSARSIDVAGEIGLAGEVRPATRGQDRLKEAAKLGFEKAIVPKANAPKAKINGLEVLAVERIDQAVRLLREL